MQSIPSTAALTVETPRAAGMSPTAAPMRLRWLIPARLKPLTLSDILMGTSSLTRIGLFRRRTRIRQPVGGDARMDVVYREGSQSSGAAA